MSIRISELTPKGAVLDATDLLEISEFTPDGYISKSITGAEIITASQEGLQPTLVSGTNIKTINGNSLLGSGDLTISGGGGLTIGTTAITSGTIGRILFEGTGNVVQESANLFWDNTNSRLGIGQSTPTARIHIQGSSALSSNSSLVLFNSTPTEIFRIRDNGNVQIGALTDAGFKLDVNGTARVQSTLTVTTVSSNGALSLTQNSVGFAAQYIYRPNVTNTIATLMFQDLKSGANFKSFSLGIGRSGDPQWTNSDFIFGFYSGSGGWQQSAKIFNSSGNWAIENATGTSDIATAILQVNSTTKGFLPPRMTTAQKNAIVSPAVGLVVYDTTLNKLCVYTTAWETITSL